MDHRSSGFGFKLFLIVTVRARNDLRSRTDLWSAARLAASPSSRWRICQTWRRSSMDIALTTRVPLLCRSRIFSPSSLRIASRSGVREMLSCRERRVSRITSLGLSSRERSMSTTLAYATSESDRPSGGWAPLAVLFDFRLLLGAGDVSLSRLVLLRVSFCNTSPAHAGATSAFWRFLRVFIITLRKLQFRTNYGIHY